jgi:hypothetical protein
VANIDSRVAQELQIELMSGESLHWAGMPNPKIIFHSDDWVLIPSSLLWAGFAVFWEAGVLGLWEDHSRGGGGSTFMALWGIPFVLSGVYMVVGRFFVDAWLKRRTYYAVTNRRLLVRQHGWSHKLCCMFLRDIPQIEREGTTTGTLWFGAKLPLIAGKRQKGRGMSRFSVGDVPVFADIDDVNSVHRLILDLRQRQRPVDSSSSTLSYSQ